MEKEKSFNKPTKKGLDFSLLKKLLDYGKKYPGLFTITIVFMLLSDVSATISPYIIKLGIDDNIVNGDVQGLYKKGYWLGIVLLFSFIMTFFFTISTQYMGQRLIFDIRENVIKKIMSMTNSYFDKNPLGRTLTYLTNDVEAIRDFISRGVIQVLGDLLKALFILIVMFTINWQLTLFTLSLSIPLFTLGTLAFRAGIRNGYRGVRRSNSRMNSLLAESITGIKEINIFNHQKKSLADFNQANHEYQNSFLKVIQSYSLYFPLIEVVSSLSMIGVLFFAHRYLGSLTTIGELFSFFIYINMFFRPLHDLAEQFNTFQSAMSGSERIFSFLSEKPAFSDPALLAPKQEALAAKSKDRLRPLSNSSSHASKPAYWQPDAPVHTSMPSRKIRGDITFDDVSFSYEKGKPAMQHVSFTIAQGEKVAIVGSTGAGKTTVISLINRLYDVSSGRILIDGEDIRSMSLSRLRGNISTLPQDVFLFTGSFYENIILDHYIDNEKRRLKESLEYTGLVENKKELFQAAQKATKKALLHDYIMRHAEGYQQGVLEEGKLLSTGQKQLLSFARAFLKNAPLLILDEATANIDSESERLIEKSLDKLLTNKTCIIIAHRLSTIRRADKILVFHHGRLVEQGPHKMLLKKSSIYKKLHELQEIQLSA